MNSFTSVLWKSARIGERLSPWISLCCIGMAVSLSQSLSNFELLAKVVEGADKMCLAFSIHGKMRSISRLLRYL